LHPQTLGFNSGDKVVVGQVFFGVLWFSLSIILPMLQTLLDISVTPRVCTVFPAEAQSFKELTLNPPLPLIQVED
jgi:hypothetical protein